MPDNEYIPIGEQASNYESTVTLTLYQNSSEPNRVDKTQYLTPASPIQITGTFKSPFNLTHPSVIIARPWLAIFNYVRIRFPNNIQVQDRYYFVTSMTAITADLFEIDLELDVLMTYKAAIEDCDAFVDRNEFTFDNLIVDNKRVIKEGYNLHNIEIATPFFTSNNEYGTFILNCINLIPFDNDELVPLTEGKVANKTSNFQYPIAPQFIRYGYAPYKISHSSYYELLEALNKVNIDTIFYGNLSKNLLSLYYLPIRYNNEISCDLNMAIKYEVADETGAVSVTTADGVEIKDCSVITSNEYGGYFLGSYTCDLDNAFYNYEPYAECEILLPFYTPITIPMKYVLGKTIYITLTIDYNTGYATYNIYSSSVPQKINDGIYVNTTTFVGELVGQYNFKLGYDLPLSSTGYYESVRNGIELAASAVATIASTYIGGAAGFAASTVTKQVRGQHTDKTYKPIEKGSDVEVLSSRKVHGRQNITTTRTHDSSGYNKSKMVNTAFDTASSSLFAYSLKPTTSLTSNSNLNSTLPLAVEINIRTCKMAELTDSYKHLYGVPLCRTERLGELYGYTEISNIHLEGDGFKLATVEEMNMIEDALSNGFIL